MSLKGTAVAKFGTRLPPMTLGIHEQLLLIYGKPVYVTFSETAPNSSYSATRAASDRLVHADSQSDGRDNVTTSNCSNDCGPYSFPEKLIPRAMVNVFNCKNIPMHGGGLNVLNWLPSSGHCAAIEAT